MNDGKTPDTDTVQDVIELKCWTPSFQALKSGDKRFEYRKDDRPYAVGKIVHQREWNPITEYTGEDLYHDITWIVRGGVFGIPEGYCIFSVTEPRSTREHIPPPRSPEAITIRLRRPMREIESTKLVKWQEDYRERLLKQIIDSSKTTSKKEWHEYFKSISTVCPDCFCPNLEEHYTESYNSKGFHCPGCGNSFDLPITPYTLVDDSTICAREVMGALDRLIALFKGFEDQKRFAYSAADMVEYVENFKKLEELRPEVGK